MTNKKNKVILVFSECYEDRNFEDFLLNLKLKKRKFKIIINNLQGYKFVKTKKYDYGFYNDYINFNDRKKIIKNRTLYFNSLSVKLKKTLLNKKIFDLDNYSYLYHFDHVFLAYELSKKINFNKNRILIFIKEKSFFSINTIYDYENLQNSFLKNFEFFLRNKRIDFQKESLRVYEHKLLNKYFNFLKNTFYRLKIYLNNILLPKNFFDKKFLCLNFAEYYRFKEFIEKKNLLLISNSSSFSQIYKARKIKVKTLFLPIYFNFFVKKKNLNLKFKNSDFDLITKANLTYINKVIYPRILNLDKLFLSFKKKFSNYKYKYAYFTNLSDGENLLIADAAKESNIKTIAITHSIYQPRINKNFIFDKILVKNKKQLLIQKSEGYKKKQIEITKEKIKSALEYRFSSLNNKKKYDYLIFSGLVDYYATEFCFKSNIRLLEQFDKFAFFKKKSIALKFHPVIKNFKIGVFKNLNLIDTKINPVKLIQISKNIILTNERPQISEIIKNRYVTGIFNDNIGEFGGFTKVRRKLLKSSVNSYTTSFKKFEKKLNE